MSKSSLMIVDYIEPLKFIALVIGRRCKMNEVLLCLVTLDSRNGSCSVSDWSANNTHCKRLETPAWKYHKYDRNTTYSKSQRERAAICRSASFGSKCLLYDNYLVVSLQQQNEFLSYDKLSELDWKLVGKEFIFHAAWWCGDFTFIIFFVSYM